MEVALVKPLQPLASGVIVIVGAKTGNFDDEIMRHPRVVIWGSQDTHWTNKDLPSNCRAVFMTRFIGHSEYSRILAEARKRQIPLFNPEGTGIIAKRVKELLNIVPRHIVQAKVEEIKEKMMETVKVETPKAEPKPTYVNKGIRGKLGPLHQFVDFNKSNVENGLILYKKAKELGIETTEPSVRQMVVKLRKDQNKPFTGTVKRDKKSGAEQDLSIEILDGIISGLKDIRTYLVSTVKENNQLKDRLEKFRKMFATLKLED